MDNPDYNLYVKETSENNTELILEGDLSLENTQKIYDELLSILAKNEINIIRLNNVTNIDLSTIQIIVSLTKSYKEMNKEITIQTNFEQQFDELFKNTEVYNIFESISKK